MTRLPPGISVVHGALRTKEEMDAHLADLKKRGVPRLYVVDDFNAVEGTYRAVMKNRYYGGEGLICSTTNWVAANNFPAVLAERERLDAYCWELLVKEMDK